MYVFENSEAFLGPGVHDSKTLVMSVDRSPEAEMLSPAQALCLVSVRVKTWANEKAKVSIFNLGSSKGEGSSQSNSRLRGYGVDLFLYSLWCRTSICVDSIAISSLCFITSIPLILSVLVVSSFFVLG